MLTLKLVLKYSQKHFHNSQKVEIPKCLSMSE
jgi:hypothetical protein